MNLHRTAIILTAALVIAGSILGGSFILRDAMDRETAELAQLRATLSRIQFERRDSEQQLSRISRLEGRSSSPGRISRHDVSTDGSPSLGTASAEVVLIEFSDFQCPHCATVAPIVARIKSEYGDRLQFVFKHLPLPIHPDAPAAHAAAEAAHLQNKFWEMYDRIFANQSNLTMSAFERYAEEIGLDMKRFRQDVNSQEVKARIDADIIEARALGVRGTPGFFVNGRFFSGVRSFESFKQIIDQEIDAK